MANVLELKIESTLDKAGIDAAKQGVQELQTSTGAATSAMSATAGAASTALTSTGAEAGKTATAVKTVGEAAKGAAAGVQALSGATAQAASATAKLGTAAAVTKTVTATAKGAATAMAGVGAAATGAGNEAVSSLNLMSMGANILTGNIMGTIQASTELAGHFKGISMIKFSGVALAIAGIATAWQWVTKKIKEYNAELAKTDSKAADQALQVLQHRYEEIAKAVERYGAAQARVAQNVDASQEVSFAEARMKNAQNREADLAAGGDGSRQGVRGQDIDNAERLYKARVAYGRATQETATAEKAYQASVRATNSQIRALNRLYSERGAMEKQARNGSMGQKAYAEERLSALDGQIASMEAAVKEGKAKAETLRAAKEQAPVEEKLAQRRLALVEADIKLTAQVRERTKLEQFQAERDAKRVEVAAAVASAEADLAAARKLLQQAEDNEAMKERTRELEKQAQLLDKQTAKAKKLLGELSKSPNRERSLAKQERDAEREARREARRLNRQKRREGRDIENLAARAGGKAIFDPDTGKFRIKGRNGKDLTHRLNAHDQKRWARIAAIQEAEAAQNNGQAAAARQLAKDLNAPNPVGDALAAVKAAEGVLDAAKTALVDFDSETEEGLAAVQKEVAAWRDSAAAAITQAGQMSNQVVEKLTAATQAQTSTLTRLLSAS